MKEDNVSNNQSLALKYDFSSREIRILARFFRKYQAQIPDGLEEFAGAVEKSVYNSMSVDEAESFFL